MKRILAATVFAFAIAACDDNDSPSALTGSDDNQNQPEQNQPEDNQEDSAQIESLTTIKRGKGENCLDFSFQTSKCSDSLESLSNSEIDQSDFSSPIELMNSDSQQRYSLTAEENSLKINESATLESINNSENASYALYDYASKSPQRLFNFLDAISNFAGIDASGELTELEFETTNGSTFPVDYVVNCSEDTTEFHLVVGEYGVKTVFNLNSESNVIKSTYEKMTLDGEIDTETTYCEVENINSDQASVSDDEASENEIILNPDDANLTVEDINDEAVVDDTTEETIIDDSSEDVIIDDTTEKVIVDDTPDEQAEREIERSSDRLAEELEDTGRAVKDLADATGDAIETKIENSAEAVEDLAEDAANEIDEAADEVASETRDAADDLTEATANGLENIQEFARDSAAVIEGVGEATAEKIEETVEAAQDEISDEIDEAKSEQDDEDWAVIRWLKDLF